MMKLVVLSCVLAAATANLIGAPWGIGAGLGIGNGLGIAGPLGLAAPIGVAGPLGLASSLGLAGPLGVAGPLGLASPLGVAGPLGLATPLGVAGLRGSNYRGPLSLAPGQSANIIAADGRPLDTLAVNVDRTAHATAKALEGGVHLLKKRSAPLIAPLAINPLLAPASLLAPAPLLARSPLLLSAPWVSAGLIASPYNIGALDC